MTAVLIVPVLVWPLSQSAYASSVATLSIAGAAAGRSVSGDVTAYFMVTLSKPLETAVTFRYATSNGTALAGQDYQTESGTSIIGPGAIRQKIGVTIYGVSRKHPQIYTPKVYFTMTISDATGASIDRSHARGTILQMPSLSIGNARVVQAQQKPPPGRRPIYAYFIVSISPRLDQPVTVDYNTVDGTAIHGVDYTAAAGSLTLPADARFVRVPVKIKAANQKKYVYSAAKTVFYVDISSPNRDVYVTRSRGTGTITEQNPTTASSVPTLSIAGPAVARSASGHVTAYFMVTLSKPLETAVTFRYATSNGTALAGQDYQAESGTSIIGPGAIRQKIGVTVCRVSSEHPVTGTSKVYFTMTISHAVGAKIYRSHARGTILQMPSLSIGNARVVQAQQKPPPGRRPIYAYFIVSISPRLDQPVTVDYNTVDGTAIHGVDYTAVSGSVTIPANAVSVRVPVIIRAANQKGYAYSSTTTVFYVRISTPNSDVYLRRSRGTGTITEQDPAARPFGAGTVADLRQPSDSLAAGMLAVGATHASSILARREDRMTTQVCLN
jgi:hypothetical protein